MRLTRVAGSMVLRVLVVAALLWSLRMHWLICYSFFIWFGVIRNYILLSSWGWGGSCHPILIQPFLINLLMCLYVIFDVPDYFSSNGIENRGCLIWGTTYIHACAVLLGRAQSSSFFSRVYQQSDSQNSVFWAEFLLLYLLRFDVYIL